jgi:guanosine-3',5'-bis(diphosphate) 3'-pyrophosphohydrolase
MLPSWQQAISFAARAHRHQLRRDGRTPYAAHVVRVAMAISQVFECRDETTITVAILHDVIEDTTTDYDDIASRFGEEVARGVAALTKNMALPEKKREADYDHRLEQGSWRVRLVKLADVYDNLCDSLTDPEAAKNRAKRVRACQRAIKIARRDAKTRKETARAIKAVQATLRGVARGRVRPTTRRK